MADVTSQNSERQVMTIGKGWLYYLGGLVLLLVLLTIGGMARTSSIVWFIAVIGYFVIGFVLNRVVLRGLIQWHPVYNTVENVSKGKLGMLLVWPIRYPTLLLKLMVVKHL